MIGWRVRLGCSLAGFAHLDAFESKHLGLAGRRVRLAAALARLAKVNGWTRTTPRPTPRSSSSNGPPRSFHPWSLDCSVLEAEGIPFEPTRPSDPAR